jgi:hypothetical protein
MIRKPLYSLVVVALAGALGVGLRAQTPIKTVKPATAPSTHIQPTTATQPTPPPPPQGSAGVCRSSDMTGHTDSPHALMMSCLNKQVEMNSDGAGYLVVSVSDAGFLVRKTENATGGGAGKLESKLVPWTAVLYYNFGAGLNIMLVR